MDPVRIGLIGVGGYGVVHLQAIAHAQELGLARLVAAVILPGLEQERERELGARGVLIYRAHGQMLQRAAAEGGAALELVGVPCGISQHAPLSIAALEAGCHVLCEKPVAGNLGDARRMLEAAEKAGRHLAVGYQNLHTRTIRRIKQIALEGTLGRLLEARSAILWPRTAAYYARNAWAGRLVADGTPIYDSPLQNAVAHYLQNLLFVAGPSMDQSATPVRLYGENYRAKNMESADTQYVRITTREGPLLSCMVTHATATLRDPVAEYRFERGVVRWQAQPNGETQIWDTRDGEGRCTERLDNAETDIHFLPYLDTCRAIREGRSPLCTVHNSIQHTACVDALFGRGELVTVPSAHTAIVGPAEDRNVVIGGIEETMERMYARGESFWEAGAPWARQGREVEL